MAAVPQRLRSTAHERPWGVLKTEPWHPNPKNATGEIWFEASASVPILIKFLFTSSNLSIQVHPQDEYAREHHGQAGKTEMWHILRAEPDAQVALGLREAVTEEELRQACETGRIKFMLNWVPAAAGDTFFMPAGTIHAIGGGLTLCEVQQLSDVTYRLYDWGRTGRELHLDHGIKVSHRHAHVHQPSSRKRSSERELLAHCDYFHTELLEVRGTAKCDSHPKNTLYVILEGTGTIAGMPFLQGETWEAPHNAAPFEIRSDKAAILTAAVP